ncbi:hypothetical protein PMKS-002355 [Pichia membranifaciens]|uniref:Uncharacterized protein n=1 Tax=Pichia membranifaciens TaxID=4926 RepID=A0A1Q2YH54_9ASCO|nr:hypothetical protein PMKS-002355 [Pichia membranifaciens]
MLKGSTKKFFVFVCIVLAMVATLGMTPATQRKKLLKPIENLYSTKNSDNGAASTELENLKEQSQSPKVIVISENAEKEVLNVEADAEHPEQLLPVADPQIKVVDDTEDTSVENAKAEAILDEVPI